MNKFSKIYVICCLTAAAVRCVTTRCSPTLLVRCVHTRDQMNKTCDSSRSRCDVRPLGDRFGGGEMVEHSLLRRDSLTAIQLTQDRKVSSGTNRAKFRAALSPAFVQRHHKSYGVASRLLR